MGGAKNGRSEETTVYYYSTISNNLLLITSLVAASICDRQKYAEVVRSYVDEKLHQGSPLHTLSLIFSGQSDGVGRGAGGGEDEGDVMLANWMTNLAAIITNRTNGWDR